MQLISKKAKEYREKVGDDVDEGILKRALWNMMDVDTKVRATDKELTNKKTTFKEVVDLVETRYKLLYKQASSSRGPTMMEEDALSAKIEIEEDDRGPEMCGASTGGMET